LFGILNLIADVITVLKLKEALAEKTCLSLLKKENKWSRERAERRSIAMFVYNSLVNVLFPNPKAFINHLFFFIIKEKQKRYVNKLIYFTFDECNAMNQISDSFYNFTTGFNILFYYFFNKTFKFAFRLIFSCCPLKRLKK
jgi:hypothetical protein